jgi:hypothetical protein
MTYMEGDLSLSEKQITDAWATHLASSESGPAGARPGQWLQPADGPTFQFTMNLKPIWGADGAVTMIHAEETMNGVTAIGGIPFSLRAASRRTAAFRTREE